MNQDKHTLFEELAAYYGLRVEYQDKEGQLRRSTTKECRDFLDSIGIQVDDEEMLEAEIEKSHKKRWGDLLQPVQLVEEGKAPPIHVTISSRETQKSYEWVVETEGGKVHRGEFFGGHLQTISSFRHFLKLELRLQIQIDPGYHCLKVKSETGRESQMKLIVVPKTCFAPSCLQCNQKVQGIHFNLFEYNPRSEYKISSYKNIENATHYLANENMGVLEVGPLSPFFYMEERVNPGIPSSRSFLNSLLVDVDELVSLIGDGDLKLKLLSNEFQEKFKKLHEEDDVDLKKIYELKREIFKVSYQYFRVKHLKNNTPISHNFFDFISSKGEKLRNVALFESLQEYFLTEDPNLKSWHEWPVDYQTPQSDAVSLFEKNNIESVQFYEFLQWQAESQLASAGQASWVNRLGIGILGDLPFFVNKQGAETWIHQNYYTRKATITIEESENETTRPLIPHQLIQNGYEHISDVFSKNMVHNGAIKIENIEGFLFLEWHYNDSTFVVEYPFEDLLGILALESQKNKCAVFVENRDFKGPCKKHLVRFGVFSNSRLELKEVAEEEEVKTFFDSIQSRRDKTKEDQNESDKLAFLHTPLSVYRVQFNKSFTFKSALAIVPYLKYLGITHCYASPILHSKTGSLHGYDTIDHSSLNPELGSIGDFVEFADTLKNHNMGLIVDIVPNHMGISPENKWWMDLLENGQASRYANFFDIDWSPIKQELSGKVLLSVLGDHYGNVLKNGEFKFYFDQNTGKLRLTYWDHEFPINPSSYSLFFEHRIELLESRLGATNSDFLEYASIMNIFKKIPGIHQTLPEKIAERNREKDIASRRLLELTSKNQTISGFIQENLVSFVGKADDPVSCNRIHNLLEEQAYRLAYWRVSSDIINYRRFFDVNELICLKNEDPLVFSSTHGFILDLLEQGKIDGLRVDHPDGLVDPEGYFRTVQKEAGKRRGIDFNDSEEGLLGSEQLPVYIVAEKILAPFEKVPENWPVHGTVGYDFLNDVCSVLIKKESENSFTKTYERFAGMHIDFNELAMRCKKIIMKTSLTGELNTLASFLNKIAEKNYSTRDYTLNSLRNALMEIIACFPVYRTYVTGTRKGSKAAEFITWAVGAAKKRSQATDPSIFDFIKDVLKLESEEDPASEEYSSVLKFTLKFQQYTGPLMAKGLEDTCFYRFNRFLALNEVGGAPDRFGISVEDFHANCLKRSERTPHSFLATSTHDTKRSEDVRARICALSEFPGDWRTKTSKWSKWNESKKTEVDQNDAPDKNDEYLFYQILLGIWPVSPPDEEGLASLMVRLEEYMIKAIREAKVHTSWININLPYEGATIEFIKKVLFSPARHPFWKDFVPFHQKISHLGFLNSLSQTALKLTCPGVPDIYQGTEFFNFSLVDPDNRRAVDYKQASRTVEEIENFVNDKTEAGKADYRKLLPFETGKVKFFLTITLLRFRQKHSALFRKGSYLPLDVLGEKSGSVIAFARVHENERLIVVVPRLMAGLVAGQSPFPVGLPCWGNTKVVLPGSLQGRTWKTIIEDSTLGSRSGAMKLAEIFDQFPIGALYSQ